MARVQCLAFICGHSALSIPLLPSTGNLNFKPRIFAQTVLPALYFGFCAIVHDSSFCNCLVLFKEVRLYKQRRIEEKEVASDRECVLSHINKLKLNGLVNDESYVDERVRLYTIERKERIANFVGAVKDKRLAELQKLYPQYIHTHS